MGVGQDSIVGIVTVLRAGWSGDDVLLGVKCFPPRADWPGGLLSSLYGGLLGLLPGPGHGIVPLLNRVLTLE